MSEELPTVKDILEDYLIDMDLQWADEYNLQSTADINSSNVGDITLTSGLKVIINDIYARLLTRRKTIIDGVTYPAETSEDDFGSSLFYILGRKKTPNNIRLAMLYVAEALIDYPYLEIQSINSEVFSSKDLNKEMVQITVKANVVIPAEGLVLDNNPEQIQVDVRY